ncbi:MAG: SixA phosphatase family protein [Solirubrobacterales bacterium]
MGKTLQLLRHAKSDWDDAARQDDQRPLSKRGRKDIALMAADAAELGTCGSVDLVVCSPTIRTRETLAGFAEALPKGAKVEFDHRLYGASKKMLYEIVNGLPESAEHVLMVGHNPGFQTFANDLLDRTRSVAECRENVAAKYPTAALATFELDDDWTEVTNGAGALTGFRRPRELR